MSNDRQETHVRERTVLSQVAWIALAGAVVLPLLMPQTLLPGGTAFAAAAAPPPYIQVTGIVRDFSRNHPDFAVVPAAGYGHFAGNIGLNAGADDRPVFVAGGFKVATQWTDRDANNIAPHLATAAGSSTVDLVTSLLIDNSPELDTYDSLVGPYGGANVGPPPTINTGVTMPVLTAPTGLPFVGDRLYNGNGTTVLDTSFHCKTFVIKNSHKIMVDKNITILVDDLFMLQDLSSVFDFNGSSVVKIYFKKNFYVQEYAVLNSKTDEPWRVQIYNLGTERVNVKNNAVLCAYVTSPNASMKIENLAHFYGSFIGWELHLKNDAGAHFDTSGVGGFDACGDPCADTLGTNGVTSTGGITSAASFNQWYRDVPGTNLSTYLPITLIDNGSGVYVYLDDDFHPIDGRLLGNEGDPNNDYFTFVIDADFTYQACASQFFEFRGADDAWLFVDGKLAIDLGGVLPLMDQHVDMDRLELTDGQSYRLIFLYAHRQPGLAMFRLRTNLILDSLVPSISAAFD